MEFEDEEELEEEGEVMEEAQNADEKKKKEQSSNFLGHLLAEQREDSEVGQEIFSTGFSWNLEKIHVNF